MGAKLFAWIGGLALFLGVAFAGIDNVALVFLARDQLGAGPAGFGAVASAFGIVRALRQLDEPEAAAGLALAVVALAYLAHAVIDYDWDFVGVSAPLFLVLGVLVAAGRPALEAVREPFFAAGAVVLGLAVLGSLASPWLASRASGCRCGCAISDSLQGHRFPSPCGRLMLLEMSACQPRQWLPFRATRYRS